MAGMQRFVTYIYAYEDGNKSGNVGYAKIEIRGEVGRIDIHFMNSGVMRGEGEASFFKVANGKINFIPIGKFMIERGMGAMNLPFGIEKVFGSEWRFEDIDGLCIVDSNQRKCLSFWKDEGLKEWREAMLKVEEQPVVLGEEKQELPEEVIEEAEQDALHTMEIQMQNVFPKDDMNEIWEEWKTGTTYRAYGDGVETVQMELKDLRELPKKYWYMGNNSFLLHGFFNYHYLLLGKIDNDKWFIGIPGTYQRQERVMASIFGFPGFFLMPNEATLQVASCEEMKEQQKGIWYHILEE